jgi:hypothetical protein
MGIVKIVNAPNEWIEDFTPTKEYLDSLNGDIFTFWQRFPDITPHYNYYMEWDNVAVLEIRDYDYWWKEQIDKKTRNMVRKAEKNKIVLKVVKFNDEFAKQIAQIYNEKPIRQGRPFKHYGKSTEQVKEKFIPWLDKSEFAGAYYENELVGFIHIIYTDKYALLSQIISYEKYRDKAVNNALISKAVEICSKKGVKYLIYGRMSAGGLGQFKTNNGFLERYVPRYYIPLSLKGRIVLSLRLHRGMRALLPKWLKGFLRSLREKYYRWRYRS